METDKSKKWIESLKMTLDTTIPTTHFKGTIFGLVYYIYRTDMQDTYELSKLTNQDHLQYLSISIDSLKADIFKKVCDTTL